MDHTNAKRSGSMLCLDRALLLSGDIVLTAYRHVGSRVIQALSKGLYSHAGIVINNAAILESTTAGIGYLPLVPERVEKLHGRARVLYEFPEDVSRAVVLRKVDLFKVATPDQVERLIFNCASLFIWKEYPQLCALASTLDSSSLIKQIGEPLVRLIETRVRKPRINPGPFCSALVATVYQMLNISLIPGTPPGQFSPNTFLKANLQMVRDAVTQPDPKAEVDVAQLELLTAIARLIPSADLRPQQVALRNLATQLAKRASANP
jgi:hypothetical protein